MFFYSVFNEAEVQLKVREERSTLSGFNDVYRFPPVHENINSHQGNNGSLQNEATPSAADSEMTGAVEDLPSESRDV